MKMKKKNNSLFKVFVLMLSIILISGIIFSNSLYNKNLPDFEDNSEEFINWNKIDNWIVINKRLELSSDIQDVKISLETLNPYLLILYKSLEYAMEGKPFSNVDVFLTLDDGIGVQLSHNIDIAKYFRNSVYSNKKNDLLINMTMFFNVIEYFGDQITTKNMCEIDINKLDIGKIQFINADIADVDLITGEKSFIMYGSYSPRYIKYNEFKGNGMEIHDEHIKKLNSLVYKHWDDVNQFYSDVLERIMDKEDILDTGLRVVTVRFLTDKYYYLLQGYFVNDKLYDTMVFLFIETPKSY